MAADENDNDQTRSFTVLAAGTTISHYKIINKIGAGGMGEVYKAEDTELKREVALKFLPAHLCRDEVCRARFLREARAAAKLRHPNIVIIYEVSEYQGRPFFAMECCEGRPLYEVIRTEKPSLDKIIDLAVQICEGLQEAHDNGIIHRDIKPSNIILDKKNRLKLLDFGLAAVRGTDQLTKAGSTMGTIGYMSPEQIQGEEAGPHSDLFSLGVVLYEMITGRKPFNGEYEAAVLNSVLNDHPEPLLRYKSGIPGELQRIVSKLLEKDPKLRYQSAAGVISDLRQLELAGVKPAGRPFWKSVLNKFLIGFLIGVTLYVVGEYLLSEGDGSGASKMLAVLPFENLGEPDDEYFADGITDEIISRLAMLHGLGVISRTSTLQYKGTLKNLRQIGKELEVDYILEGSIRWSKSGEESRVRINPQLIRVADDVHLWADRYDAVIDDIFTVQSSIAEKVIDALDITLLESERRALNEQPTDNTEAYDYYLRGHEYLDNHNVKDYMNAEAMFNRAIELEPDFVSAYSWLAITHLQLYSQYFDRTEQRLHSAKEALDRALDIGPDNYDALGAQAWYLYAGLGDFDRALSEFIELRNKLPNEHMLSLCIALIKRRKGQWEDAVEDYKRALRLDPRSSTVYLEYGTALLYLRRYAEVEALYNRALELKPDFRQAYENKSLVYIYWKGDFEASRRVLENALERIERWPGLTEREAELAIMTGEYDRALMLLTELCQTEENQPYDSAYYYNLKGSVYRYRGEAGLMVTYYDSARVILERLVSADPADPWNRAELGLTYAGLGRRDDAVREGQRAVELLPVKIDALDGVYALKNLAIVYAIIGEYDLACELFDDLLARPSEVSVPYLKIWPDFKPFLNQPCFRALMEKYGDKNI